MALLINELRIGNLVLSGKNEIVIYNIHKDCINYAHAQGADEGYSIESLTGIPLTEEWLLKFGFENGAVKGGFSFDKNKLSIHLKSTSYPNGRTYFNSWCILEYAVKYVHQLQNLYFALTGEELEVKE